MPMKFPITHGVLRKIQKGKKEDIESQFPERS